MYVVRDSGIHGRGVFATRTIRKGTTIIEYRGERTTWAIARRRPDSDPDNPAHTFIFETTDGIVIDADVRGNAARWINHSCAPNCESYEDDDGRVFIEARRTIRAGDELTYDYRLSLDGRIRKRACAPRMLAAAARALPGLACCAANAPLGARSRPPGAARWPGSARFALVRHLVVCEHTSQVLADNPLGDPHVRKLAVWLPPQYDERGGRGRGRRFPVLYDLVGFTGSGLSHVGWKTVQRQRARARRAPDPRAARWRPRSSCSPTASRRSAATST